MTNADVTGIQNPFVKKAEVVLIAEIKSDIHTRTYPLIFSWFLENVQYQNVFSTTTYAAIPHSVC